MTTPAGRTLLHVHVSEGEAAALTRLVARLAAEVKERTGATLTVQDVLLRAVQALVWGEQLPQEVDRG